MDSQGITAANFLTTAIVLIVTLVFLRLVYVLPVLHPHRRQHRNAATHILIFLGSGGHTAEMIDMMLDMPLHRYQYRTYVTQSNDLLSGDRARQFEACLRTYYHGKAGACVGLDYFRVLSVPRARNIHQSLLNTPLSAFSTLRACISILLDAPAPNPAAIVSTPDVIVTNGPASGVMLIIAAFILKFLGLNGQGDMKTVYVESFARVNSLSLSGKILKYLGLTHEFVVQWPQLRDQARKGTFRGTLVR